MDANCLEQVRRVFAADRYAALTGVAIEQAGLHEAFCVLDVDERHCNARGTVMGGVLFTLADFCAAVAANAAEADLHWVSLDSSIHFLSPAEGGRLTATCRALKHGRTTALYQTIIESLGHSKQIAVAETTMVHV